ncbi:MAG: endo-1,4-beta-xylanase [Prolixibacteraceae bacterium]|nr:endo-1,4-beta-xylanase [Prolixibacteraceae bacterium]
MKQFSIFILLMTVLLANARANGSDNVPGTPVIIEAEAGMAGSNFITGVDGNTQYITANVSFTGQTSPEDSASTINYEVSFSEAGNYHLFARIKVGSGGFNDDSFFAGNSFGNKEATNGSEWIMVNGLAEAGFSSPSAVVHDKGGDGSGMWKWVNITNNFFPDAAANQPFKVEEDALTQSFSIGSREDGLQFDKFAFGLAGLFYTVEALDNGLPGTNEVAVDSSKYYQGPPLADGSPKFLGNLRSRNDNNFAFLWNQLTPENEGKWASVGNSTDTTRWSWGGLDNLYNYARENNMPFKNHTLIWGAQQPTWISSQTPEKQLEYIEYWIKTTGERYPEIDMIDVVNEALPNHNPPDGRNDRANYKAALGGDGETGWDWVIKSFELARKYIPNATLILNDYGIINDNGATSTYLKIINLLKERDLIDGIGVQGHRFELESVNTAIIKGNLDRLGATGLPIYISEFDMGNLNNQGTPNDEQQLQLYQKVFPILWEHPSVAGITLWGYIESRMWQETCHLVLADGTWRPALKWLAQYIKDTPVEINLPVSSAEINAAEMQLYPNPFSAETNFVFRLKNPGNISLKIYDLTGRTVKTLLHEEMESGHHALVWDGRDQNGNTIKSGTYIYKLITNDQTVSGKLLRIE